MPRSLVLRAPDWLEQIPWKDGKPSIAEGYRHPRVTNYKCQTEKVIVTQGFSLDREGNWMKPDVFGSL